MLNGYEYRGFFEKQYIDFCTDHGFIHGQFFVWASRIKISFSVVAGMNLVMSGMLGMAVWIGNGFSYFIEGRTTDILAGVLLGGMGISDLSLCSDTKAKYDEKNKKIKFYEWDYSGNGTVY